MLKRQGIWAGRTFFVLLLVLAVRSAAAARSPVLAAKARKQGRYSVLDFHAAGDGKTDDAPVTASVTHSPCFCSIVHYHGKAFLEAWQTACSDGSSPVLVIPGGWTFLLSKIRFQGSCKSPITVQLDGNIVAPNYIWTAESDNLLTFYRIDNLTVAGNGQIDGRGAIWWSCYNHKLSQRCTHRPNVSTHTISPSVSFMWTLRLVHVNQLLAFAYCNNLWVRNIHLKDSAEKHMTLYRCSQAHVDSVSVTAPAHSPNTDGINMALSDHVYISSCSMQTGKSPFIEYMHGTNAGDDCVSILSGTTDAYVTDTTCGPGHGIRYKCATMCMQTCDECTNLSSIYVHVCLAFVSSYLLMVAYWGGTGKANGFLFENLNMTAVRFPIDIDQFYCPPGNCPTRDGGVAITDARFINIHGTSSEKQAIQILCSQSVPCRGIYLHDVTLYWNKKNHVSQAQSRILNAHGTIVGNVVPEVQFITAQ
ncbi:probable polygalacturonase At1g80170 [Brachypodium distachyon]|uniref:probable polygalacturonase At1g80170 n=1 Tax=Brachypodium distachyon TaxID=15368 RepID=UPI000D0DAA39|nr:probable polygalacturonase At1g80170 [Brachypodium distachyon]|eukprot:XP_024313988.1 probable polygalacturonase At1g80170 [Brachypodium distachyon]